MTGDGHPERIYSAQRARVLARLTRQERLSVGDAEEWVARWEAEAEAETKEHPRESTGFWGEAWRWIADQRTGTKTDMGAQGDDGQVFGG